MRAPVPILRYERTGASIDTLAVVPGPERYAHVVADGQWIHSSSFSPHPVIHGGRTVLYSGAADRMEIEVFGPDGLVRVIRIPDFDLATTDEDWQEEIDRIRDIARRFEERHPESAPGRVEDVPRRLTRPAYSRFLEDSEENLWVADFDPSYAHRGLPPSPRWTVFDPEGRWLGSVETPAGLTVTEIEVDHILGIARVDGRSVARVHELSRQTSRDP